MESDKSWRDSHRAIPHGSIVRVGVGSCHRPDKESDGFSAPPVPRRTHLVPKEVVIQVLSVGISGELTSDPDDSERDFGGH